MSDEPSQPASAISAALCIAPAAIDRFGKLLRHLVVGLVDQAIGLRLLSSDQRIETLRLGPVQTLVHQPISWPMGPRRLTQLVDVLSHQPPKIIHAMSHESYAASRELADELEADLVLQVSSVTDCDMIAEMDRTQVGSYIAISEWLRTVLTDQIKVPAGRIFVVYPGVLVSPSVTCFAHPGRAATVLCTSDFERHSGVDVLVHALALLRRRGHTPLAFLLGKGRYESALRKMVRERDLSSSVTFANPSGDVESVMRSADIFVRPSTDTTFVADALLAMGTGALVISFATELVDFLRHDETALIARSKTADALAESIAQAMSDTEEARRIAAGGLEYVRAHHGVSVMAERTATVYRQLVLSGSTFAINRT